MDISPTPSPPHADTQPATASAATSTQQAPAHVTPLAAHPPNHVTPHRASIHRTDWHSVQAHQLTQSPLPHESLSQHAEHAAVPPQCSSRLYTSNEITNKRPTDVRADIPATLAPSILAPVGKRLEGRCS